MRRIVVLVPLAMSLACDPLTPATGEQASSPRSGPVEASAAKKAHRADLDVLLTKVRDGLIAGDLASVKRSAQKFSQALPDGAQPPFDTISTTSKTISSGSDHRGAATALVDLAVACGACHQKRGVTPEVRSPTSAQDPSPAMQMQLHQWAVDRMWEGLVRPSDDDWRRGAQALVRDPLADADHERLDPERQGSIERVHNLADQAANARDLKQRARVYRQLLQTCGGCHGQ